MLKLQYGLKKKKTTKVKDLSGQDDFLPSLMIFHPQNPHAGRENKLPQVVTMGTFLSAPRQSPYPHQDHHP